MTLDEIDPIVKIQGEIPSVFNYLASEFGRNNNLNLAQYQRAGAGAFANGTLKTLLVANCDYSFNGSTGKVSDSVRFLVKYFWPLQGVKFPEGFLRTDGKPWERERRAYSLLEGVAGVPKAVLLKEILLKRGLGKDEIRSIMRRAPFLSRSLLLQYIDGTILEKDIESLQGEENRQRRFDLFASRLEPLVAFQFDATANYLDRNSGDVAGVVRQRPFYERMIDYTRASLGYFDRRELDEAVLHEVTVAFNPLSRIRESASRDKPRRRICHGDLRARNIVDGCFIDAKPRAGDGIEDVASFVTTHGAYFNPADWIKMAHIFRRVEVDRAGAEKRGWRDLGINPEVIQSTNGVLIGGVIESAYRTLAKTSDTQKYFPDFYASRLNATKQLGDEEEGMLKHLDNATSYVLANLKDTGFLETDRDNFKRMRDLFERVGEKVRFRKRIAPTTLAG